MKINESMSPYSVTDLATCVVSLHKWRLWTLEAHPNETFGNIIIFRSPIMLCMSPYRATCPKWYFNGFGPSQKVCYKNGLKMVFKWSTPFKQHFNTIFIAYLWGGPKPLKLSDHFYSIPFGKAQNHLNSILGILPCRGTCIA